MSLRNTLPLFALLLTFSMDGAVAQQTADIDGVKAASKAFYEAVVVIDDGTAMEKVWAQTPYVTYVGPRSTAVIRWLGGSEEILGRVQQAVFATIGGAG